MAEKQVGFSGPTNFCKEADLTMPTYLKLVRTPEKSNTATKERVARALQFKEWAELERAYKADDVGWGLTPIDMVRREPPPPDGRPMIPETIEITLQISSAGKIKILNHTDSPNSQRVVEILQSTILENGIVFFAQRPPMRNAAKSISARTDRPIPAREPIDPDTGKVKKKR